MYYMLHCFSPPDADLAMLSYRPDHPLRRWTAGQRFENPPPEPVRATVKAGYSGVMAEFWDVPVPLMTKRLHEALVAAGVSNLDVFQAEITDPSTQQVYTDYVAFNLIGKVAAADMDKSVYDPSIPWFDAVAINNLAARGQLLFRLAESTNAIMIHEGVKARLEAAGINTLTFVPPDKWAG